LVAEIAGVKPPSRKVPYSLALIVGFFSQNFSRITKKEPVVTVSQVKFGAMGEHFDCSKAINELGLPQTPIRETVEKAFNWFKENGYIIN
jgi:dihydroflavonol-4-reductase